MSAKMEGDGFAYFYFAYPLIVAKMLRQHVVGRREEHSEMLPKAALKIYADIG